MVLLFSMFLVYAFVCSPLLDLAAAGSKKQADSCSLLPDNGVEFILGDPYMDHGSFSLFCGINAKDGQLADQAALTLKGNSLVITKQGKSYVKIRAVSTGASTIQAVMPDQSVVALNVSVISLAQSEQQRDPSKLTIQEALQLVRMKVNDLDGYYDYTGMDEYGGYHIQDVISDKEYLGESSNYYINPEDGTMYNVLNGAYMDNLLSDKHDPPLESRVLISLLKQRISKTVPPNFVLQATGSNVRGSIEFGLYPVIKTSLSSQPVPDISASPSVTYLVNPGTGYIYDHNGQYIGTVYNSRMALNKNWDIYPNSMLRDYYSLITRAVNENDSTCLNRILKPGSSIDKQQTNFAKKMYASGITEQFGIYYTIDHRETVSSKMVRIYVNEETLVTPKTGKSYTVNEKWMYQAEKETHTWRFTAMKRWK